MYSKGDLRHSSQTMQVGYADRLYTGMALAEKGRKGGREEGKREGEEQRDRQGHMYTVSA